MAGTSALDCARGSLFALSNRLEEYDLAKPKSEAWNEHIQLLLSASRAHIEYLVLQSFTSLLTSLQPRSRPLFTPH